MALLNMLFHYTPQDVKTNWQMLTRTLHNSNLGEKKKEKKLLPQLSGL
jgi:hypothetical protein